MFLLTFSDFPVDFLPDRMYNTYERVHRKGRSFMNEDFSADLLTLVDEDGQEHEFEILDVIENDDGVFYALLPTFEDPQEELDSEGLLHFRGHRRGWRTAARRSRGRGANQTVFPPSSNAALTRCSRKGKTARNKPAFAACLVRGPVRQITLQFLIGSLAPAVDCRPPGFAGGRGA